MVPASPQVTGGAYMLINVIGRQLEITPAIKTYLTVKANS